MFHALDVSTSGLVAQRVRMDTIASNIANVNTTSDEQGRPSPFQRRLVEFMPESQSLADNRNGTGVRYEVQVDKDQQPRKVYQPGHPDADASGYVKFPDINLVTEFVNALEASRAYEANVATIELTKSMMTTTLKILA